MKTIVLLTDFSVADPYVGMMKGVIYSINKDANIVDLTHEIPKYNVKLAAYILKISYRFFPKNSVFCIVVDPGVGSERKPVIIKSKNYLWVGPDNGVLLPAVIDDGIIEAYEILPEVAGLPEISHTFHGRDLFAPAAAYLSLGISPEAIGRRLDLNILTKIKVPPEKPKVLDESTLEVAIFYIDSFGNLVLDSPLRDIVNRLGIAEGSKVAVLPHCKEKTSVIATIVKTFSQVPEGNYAVYEGSYLLAEIAQYMGNASRDLGVMEGDKICVKRM
jgi:hypothetical protein